MLMANTMPILSMLPINTIPPQFRNLSSIGNSPSPISQFHNQTLISIRPKNTKFNTIIRNGGGPRTFPGGVSKWQWKRMQMKKQKQLLKARLCRERQIYEMRKRAELKAAVSELERPWEVVERAPALFSLSADEQVKTLADRFQKPGGFDLWSDRDGPQLFTTHDGLPTARFLPKGAVHSVKPYGVRSSEDAEEERSEGVMYNGRKKRLRRKNFDGEGEGEGLGRVDDERNSRSSEELLGGLKNLRISSTREGRSGEGYGKNVSRGSVRSDESKRNVKLENSYGGRGRMRSNESSRNGSTGSSNRVQWGSKQLPRDSENSPSRNLIVGSSNRVQWGSKQLPRDNEYSPRMSTRQDGERFGNGVQREGPGRGRGRSRGRGKVNVTHAREAYDMSLKHDGSYELQGNPQKDMFLSDAFDDDFELDLTNWRTNKG